MGIEFSLVVLTRNSENVVEENIIKIHDYLSSLDFLNKFEIVVSDYSDDNTFSILMNLVHKIKFLNPVKAPRKGIGCGILTGVEKSTFEYVMCYPIDMAWDVKVIKESLQKMIEGHRVVLGSRGVENSISIRPLKRKVFSKCYNILVNLLFHLNIHDTQGTVAFRKSDYVKYGKSLNNDGPFIQTEILIYSKILGLKIIEIPVLVTDMRNDSFYHVFNSSLNLLHDVIVMKMKLIFKK